MHSIESLKTLHFLHSSNFADLSSGLSDGLSGEIVGFLDVLLSPFNVPIMPKGTKITVIDKSDRL